MDVKVKVSPWPGNPFASCLIPQRAFSRLSVLYKQKCPVGKFDWGSWLLVELPKGIIISRCFPSIFMPLLEEIYDNPFDLILLPNAISVDNSGHTSNTLVTNAVMTPIIPTEISTCESVSVTLVYSFPHTEKINFTRQNHIKILLGSVGAIIKEISTIKIKVSSMEYFVFRIKPNAAMSSTPFYRITKETIFDFIDNSSRVPMFGQSQVLGAINDPINIICFQNEKESKSFQLITSDLLALSISDVISCSVQKTIEAFQGWLVQHFGAGNEIISCVIIKELRDFFTLDETFGGPNDRRIWIVLLGFVKGCLEKNIKVICTTKFPASDIPTDLFALFHPKVINFISRSKLKSEDLLPLFKKRPRSESFLSDLNEYLGQSTLFEVIQFIADLVNDDDNDGGDAEFASKIKSHKIQMGLREKKLYSPLDNWDVIGGYDQVKLEIQQAIEWPLRYPSAFAQLGLQPCSGIILYGPPGCSKTSLARVAAAQCGVKFISYDCAELYSCYVGESERLVREIFRNARTTVPCTLFFDEIDALVGSRSIGGSGSVSSSSGSGSGPSNKDVVQERILSTFLNEMDGIEPLSVGILVMAATNRIDLIDPALLRPGRFDRHIHVPLPDSTCRKSIFEVYVKKLPIPTGQEEIIDRLALVSEGWSGAQCRQLCHEAALFALREDPNADQMGYSHFEAVIQAMYNRNEHKAP